MDGNNTAYQEVSTNIETTSLLRVHCVWLWCLLHVSYSIAVNECIPVYVSLAQMSLHLSGRVCRGLHEEVQYDAGAAEGESAEGNRIPAANVLHQLSLSVCVCFFFFLAKVYLYVDSERIRSCKHHICCGCINSLSVCLFRVE